MIALPSLNIQYSGVHFIPLNEMMLFSGLVFAVFANEFPRGFLSLDIYCRVACSQLEEVQLNVKLNSLCMQCCSL